MLAIISTALAQTGRIPRGGIVPDCDPAAPASSANACNLDALLTMGENIVNTLIALAFLATVFFLIWGAFRMITSQGAPENINSAKSSMTSAIIGLIIVLVSWVVLNSTLNFFLDKERCERKWWQFQGLQCELTSPDEV